MGGGRNGMTRMGRPSPKDTRGAVEISPGQTALAILIAVRSEQGTLREAIQEVSEILARLGGGPNQPMPEENKEFAKVLEVYRSGLENACDEISVLHVHALRGAAHTLMENHQATLGRLRHALGQPEVKPT